MESGKCSRWHTCYNDSIFKLQFAVIHGVDPYNGVAIISGEANNVAIKREDGNPVGVGSLHGTDFSYQFTWHDNLDGTYTTSSIINPLDWSDKAARTITYSVRDGTREELHFSGWPEGTYLKRG